MKAFIVPTYTFTPGASGVGTVNLSGIASFDKKRLIAIINQTSGELIYSTASASLKYTNVTGSVVTLFKNTSSMTGTDVLQVVYEDPSDTPVSAASLPLPVGASTSAKQDLLLTELQFKAKLTDTQPVSGPLTDAQLRLSAVPVSAASLPLPTGAATEATLSAASAKLPATIGQKSMAASLAVTIASDQGAVPVSGTFFQATQPVSAAALPLPVGASTSAKQDLFLAELQLKADLTETQPVSQVTASGAITNIQKAVGVAAVRATVAGTSPSATRKKLLLKSSKNNTGNIFLGSATVTTANGMEIIGPDRLEFLLDSSDYYLISDVAGQVVEIIEVG